MIAANSFGSGVTDILDLSGNNNPFSQATSGSRAAWFREPKRGRVNLLVQTEDLTNAVWSKIGTTNPVLVGGGVFRLDNFSVANGTRIQQRVLSAPSATWSAGIDVRGEGSDIGKPINILLIRGTAGATVSNSVTVNLTADWQRVEVSRTLAADNVDIDIRVNMVTGGPDAPFVRFPQLELGSTPTAYQRVTTAFDVTEQGQRDCYGVRADGIDDFYTTASTDFTGTDKVTIFAALRRRVDTAGMIVELSSNYNTNQGTFTCATGNNPSTATGPGFLAASRGTAAAVVAQNAIISGLNPPVHAVLAVTHTISSPLSTIRANGVAGTSSTADKGTGNFGNFQMFLGRRGGTSLPFDGDILALIVAGGSYPLSTIQRVERLLSRITPTVNL
jgi:hypothetical protein